MNTLKITSLESLDQHVADVVRLKIKLTQATAMKDAEVAAVEKKHLNAIGSIVERIAALEADVLDYATANKGELFADKKSRETTLAVIGFETTPPRVETANRKIKWADVVERLQRLVWGKAYLSTPDPKPDKNALLADREKLSPEQVTAAGIQFLQDEQFFIRPKPETAAETVTKG